MKNRGNLLIVILSVLTLLFVSGCGSGATLASYDIELKSNIAKKISLPKDSKIQMNMGDEDEHIVMFRPGAKFSDAEKFFSKEFSSGGWKLEEEDLTDREEGERESIWRATGHGATVEMVLGAFGGKDTDQMVGTMLITYEK